MVDTLSKAPQLITDYLKKYVPKFEYTETKEITTDECPSLTEPDNGHKTESICEVDYSLESERLKTFANFKSDAVKPEDLAKAGFYFLNRPNKPDLVKCAFCSAEICQWEAGDVPLEEHIRWSPRCRFVKAHCTQTRNTLSFLVNPQGQDVCGNAEFFPNSLPEKETFTLLNRMVNGLSDEKVRLESFDKWPKTVKQSPEALAKAGFYYIGQADVTMCFSCGKALQEWKEEDDPWEQHARWYPNCEFVLTTKGQKYVEEVQRKFRLEVPCNNATKDESEKEESVCKPSSSSKTPSDDGVLLCKICDMNERSIFFVPCRHLVACSSCSQELTKCPVCRKVIEDRIKVFVS